MKVKDKALKVLVDVSHKDCPNRECYWARPDPGVFTQGQGYRQRASGDKGFICGHREIHGCPDTYSVRNGEDGKNSEVGVVESQK